ncbi:hypothetical protein VZQ01_39105 [Myxococcus faecalis]|uniref:hypothetical protein n=1 Tax=Myxococcus faecalis TaxID=3115646 RepID=UPI003CEE623F
MGTEGFTGAGSGAGVDAGGGAARVNSCRTNAAAQSETASPVTAIHPPRPRMTRTSERFVGAKVHGTTALNEADRRP